MEYLLILVGLYQNGLIFGKSFISPILKQNYRRLPDSFQIINDTAPFGPWLNLDNHIAFNVSIANFVRTLIS